MRVLASILVLSCTALLSYAQGLASPTCPEEQDTKQLPPADPAVCDALDPVVRSPRATHLKDYETNLNQYLDLNCHRRLDKGWKVDKRIRDTGPWTGTYQGGQWTGDPRPRARLVLARNVPLAEGKPIGRRNAVTNRCRARSRRRHDHQGDVHGAGGGMRQHRPEWLKPIKGGMAVMIRDRQAAYDGWFWGAIGWSGWQADWPPAAANPLPFSGFGQYCTNCHASAADNYTFAALKNIKDEPGQPLVFLSQNFFLDPSWQSLHIRIIQSAAKGAPPPGEPPYNPAFTKLYWSLGGPPPRSEVGEMPSQTYDNVWVKANEPTAASQYVTSDQCLGCHSAGGTGLQYDMTAPGTDTKLINLSPYGTWRGSPMGLAGRDPIFFAQLASETQTFHRNAAPAVENTCLGCHGILGQRQAEIDSYAKNGTCEKFSRAGVDAVPYPPDNPSAPLAHYGALARDGISCTSCHRMVLGKTDEAKYAGQPQNKCVEQRQQELNPGLAGFAKTFTGSFLVGPPDQLYGPFQEPKKKPMKHAIGNDPEHSANVLSAEMCG